jgi:uncharacterized protein (TIGR03067 family)
MFRCFLTVAIAILVVMVGFTAMPKAAPAPKLSDKEKDQVAFQGTWRCECFERVMDKGKPLDTTFAIDKDRFTLKNGTVIAWQGTYTIDVSKDPKEIDMTVTLSHIDNDGYKGTAILGVYKFDKETLQLCVLDPACQHPNPKFPPRGHPSLSPTENGDYLYTFKKAKP